MADEASKIPDNQANSAVMPVDPSLQHDLQHDLQQDLQRLFDATAVAPDPDTLKRMVASSKTASSKTAAQDRLTNVWPTRALLALAATLLLTMIGLTQLASSDLEPRTVAHVAPATIFMGDDSSFRDGTYIALVTEDPLAAIGAEDWSGGETMVDEFGADLDAE